MLQPMSIDDLEKTRPLTEEELLAKKKLEDQQNALKQQTATDIGDAVSEMFPTKFDNSNKYQKMMQTMQASQPNQVDLLAQQRQKTLQRLMGA
jgi:hypothetical protein